MPVVQKLGQRNRLRISSPVSIQNSGNARVAGEALTSMGAGVERSANTLQQFFKEADDTEKKIKLAAMTEVFSARAQDALLNTKISGASDGKDHLSIYDKGFNDSITGMIDGIDDTDFKAEAQVAAQRAWTKYRDNVVSGAMQSKLKNMAALERKTFGQKLSNVSSNPYNVLEDIESHKTNMKNYDQAYDSASLEEQSRTDSKQLVLTALDSLASKGKFDDAERLLAGGAAEYVTDDIVQIRQRLDNQKESYENRQLKNQDEADKKLKKATETRQDETFADFYTKLNNPDLTPNDRETLQAQVGEAQAKGFLTPTQMDGLQRENKEAVGTGSDRAANKYVQDIETGKLEGISSRIVNDPTLTRAHREHLLSKVKAERAREAKGASDPTYKRDVKIATTMIQSQNGGLFNDMGSMLVPENKINQQLQMEREMNDMIDSGMKPIDAAKRVIKNYYSDRAATDFIPSRIVPMDEQDSIEDLERNLPRIKKEIFKLRKSGTKEDTEYALKVLEMYEARKKVLQYQKKELLNGQ